MKVIRKHFEGCVFIARFGMLMARAIMVPAWQGSAAQCGKLEVFVQNRSQMNRMS